MSVCVCGVLFCLFFWFGGVFVCLFVGALILSSITYGCSTLLLLNYFPCWMAGSGLGVGDFDEGRNV